jgi:hypothetical protein
MKTTLVLSLLLFARIAHACSCVGAGTVEQTFKQADLVFAGIVEKIEDPGGDRIRALPEEQQFDAWRAAGHEWGPQRGRKVTFRVMQWWKGEDLPETVEIWTGYGGGDCGYPVEQGQSYLIYSNRTSQNRFVMGICGRTAALVCATGDVAQLGDPIKTYDTFDRETLIAREQPYTKYWRPCIEGPLLIGERGLTFNKHCLFTVDGIIDRNGTVRNFQIVRRPEPWLAEVCPAAIDQQVKEKVAKWRFRPATIDGVPVEMRFTRVTVDEPINEAQYEKFLREQKERELKLKNNQQEKH